jgi:hypothetical protein
MEIYVISRMAKRMPRPWKTQNLKRTQGTFSLVWQTDGVQPFGDDKKYRHMASPCHLFQLSSASPVFVGRDNPAWRHPGRKTKEPKLFKFKLHSYLKVFIDELAFLSATG